MTLAALKWATENQGATFALCFGGATVLTIVAICIGWEASFIERRFQIGERVVARARLAADWLDANPLAIATVWILAIGIGTLALIRWPS